MSNPPYSTKWDGRRQPAADQRPALRPGRRARAEVEGRPGLHDAHAVSWLAVNGTAAIVEFPGVLYRGGAEQKIRKYLVDNNYVDTVIQLPPDLFFGTTIATCIIVLKKSKTDNKVLFIDASAQFERGGNKNKLHRRAPADDPRRVHCPRGRRHFATLVTSAEIAANDFSLAASSYVARADNSATVDLDALNAEVAARSSARQAELRTELDSIIENASGGPLAHIDDLISEYCPNGVESRPLGKLGRRNKGTSITAARMRSIQASDGPIRVFAAGQTIADVAEDAVPSGHVIRAEHHREISWEYRVHVLRSPVYSQVRDLVILDR